MITETLRVTELRQGDRFVADGKHHYTVWSTPHRLGSDEVVVPVQFADGGLGERVFDSTATLTIERP